MKQSMIRARELVQKRKQLAVEKQAQEQERQRQANEEYRRVIRQREENERDSQEYERRLERRARLQGPFTLQQLLSRASSMEAKDEKIPVPGIPED